MNKKLFFKKIVAGCLFHAGVFQLFHKINKKPIILMYHRVIKNTSIIGTTQPGMYVTVDTFKKQMHYLTSNYKIISFDKLVSLISKNEDINNCIVITFDDGWIDNYTQAYAILKEMKIPAMVFLSTGFVGTDRCFWPEEIIFYLNSLDGICSEKNELLAQLMSELKVKKITSSKYDEAISKLKMWTPELRSKLIDNLRICCRETQSERQLMNWSEVKEMYESGLVTFGAHTANHVILDQVPHEEAEKEISQSRDDIKKHLGIAPEFFAYPNGNYTPEIKELLKKHGFKAAVTTKRGKITDNTDLFEISRIGMHDDVSNTVPMFLARTWLKWF